MYDFFFKPFTFTSIGIVSSYHVDDLVNPDMITVVGTDSTQTFELDFTDKNQELKFDFDPPMTTQMLEIIIENSRSEYVILSELYFYGLDDS